MRSIALGLTLAACTYDGSVGRTYPPVAPGHLEARWAVPIGGLERDVAQRVEMGPSGHLVVVGQSFGPTDFAAGAAMLPPAVPTEPSSLPDTAFVALRSGVDGAHRWGATIEGAPTSRIFDVTVAGDGSVYVAGLRGAADASSGAAFVIKYDPAGQLAWERGFGPSADVGAYAVAVGNDGTVFVGGGFTGALAFGDAVLTSTDGHDAFVVSFDPAGSPIWQRSFAGVGDDRIADLVAVGQTLVVAGKTEGHATFGGEILDDGTGAHRVVIARFTAAGEHAWSRIIASDRGRVRIDVGADDMLAVTATLHDATQGLGVQYLDALGTTYHEAKLPGFVESAAVAPNGMILTTGDNTVGAYDGDGAGVGTTEFEASPVPYSGNKHLVLPAVDATRDGIVVAGTMWWGVDFGSGMLWPHGAGPADPGVLVNNGSDAVVVRFDWIPD